MPLVCDFIMQTGPQFKQILHEGCAGGGIQKKILSLEEHATALETTVLRLLSMHSSR